MRTFRIYCRGGLGDILLSTPAIRSLKRQFPDHRIVVYFRTKGQLEIYRNNPDVSACRSERFWHDPLVHLLRKAGWVRFLTTAYGRCAPSLTYNRSAMDIIAEMLGVEPGDRRIGVFLTEDEERTAEAVVQGRHNLIALHASPTFSKNKAWPVSSWETLVRSMPEYRFLQLGITGDDTIAGTEDLRGRTTLREAMAIIRRCSSFVGVDSALAHSTNAFGIPGVVLFGASDPAVWGHSNNINIYKQLRCAPCIDILGGSECPYGGKCMQLITPAEVKAALEMQLQRV